MKFLDKVAIGLLATFILTGCSSSRHHHKGGVAATTAEHSLVHEFEKNVGDRAFFAYDSSALTHNSKEVLEKQAHWLKEHAHVKATIQGHADERGTEDYNMALGERRAEEARKFLIHHGVDAHRLDTVSFGKSRPAVIGNNEEAWKHNRRAVTAIHQ